MQLIDRVDRLRRSVVPADTNSQRDPAVLIDHFELLVVPPIHALVDLQGDRPVVLGILSKLAAPACLQDHVIACAGAAGAVTAPPPAGPSQSSDASRFRLSSRHRQQCRDVMHHRLQALAD